MVDSCRNHRRASVLRTAQMPANKLGCKRGSDRKHQLQRRAGSAIIDGGTQDVPLAAVTASAD